MMRVVPLVAELSSCLRANRNNTLVSVAIGKDAASAFNLALPEKQLISAAEQDGDGAGCHQTFQNRNWAPAI